MQISSPEIEGTVPAKFTCDGEDVIPPLEIRDTPPGTKSFAIIFSDPDAVKVMGTVYYHWLVWNIPSSTLQIEEGQIPGVQGTHSGGKIDYHGPCPPEQHRYVFRLYALDTELSLPEGSTHEQLEEAMRGHILEQAEFTATYERQQ